MTTSSQIPAALCGLYPGARTTIISTPKNGVGTAGRRMEDGCWSVRFDSGDFGWWAPEVLSLLLDSPLALCHAARWLAQRRGHPPVSTAPEWSVECDSDGALCWRLRSGDEADWFPTVDTDLTDAQALAAACMVVGGAS